MAKKTTRSKPPAGKPISPALRHWQKTRRATSTLETLRSFEGENVAPRVLAYLRKLDPFVFEEIILTALDEAGYAIRRNWRYTGDGGVDGRITDADGNEIVVQAKRYTGFVRPSDVEAFAALVERWKVAYGVFVHTGKTGPKSHWKKGKKVVIVSGNHLVRLLLRPGESLLKAPSPE